MNETIDSTNILLFSHRAEVVVLPETVLEFKRRGYCVIVAKTWSQARSALEPQREKQISLIIVDIGGGYGHITIFNRDFSTIPILAIDSEEREWARDTMLKAGADAFLAGPLTAHRLLASVDAVFVDAMRPQEFKSAIVLIWSRDEEFLRSECVELERQGYRTTRLEDWSEVDAILKGRHRRHIRVVAVDMNTGGCGQVQLVRDHIDDNIPIIALGSHFYEKSRESIREWGASEVLFGQQSSEKILRAFQRALVVSTRA